ncbi:MAG: MATE family efflux transporter, partial [Firmicutes bacterium]|nr:MATE family efflux transporter [Bacillota bacterium]
EGRIVPTAMFLTLPSLLMVVVASLNPIIDSFFISNYAGTGALAAIKYMAQIQNVFVMGAGGISVAGAAFIGQLIGAGDRENSKRVGLQFFTLCAAFGVTFIPIIILSGYFLVFRLEPGIRDMAHVYNVIFAFSLPLQLVQNAYNVIKNSSGHPEGPFLRELILLPTKLLFTAVFVVFLRMGTEGAALATVCSYGLLCVWVVAELFVKKGEERFSYKGFRVDARLFRRMMRVAVPAIILGSTKSAGFFIVNLELVKYGSAAIAGNGIGSDINQLFMNLTTCVGPAITTMVSLNVGAGQPKRAKKCSDVICLWASVFSVLLAAVCILAMPAILPLYTRDPFVYGMAYDLALIYGVSYPFYALIFNQSASFSGLGKTTTTLIIQSLRVWVFRFGILYLMYWLTPQVGVYSVIWSFSLCNVAAAGVSHFFYKRINWEKKLI